MSGADAVRGLSHVTLTSGHMRRSLRTEISAVAMAAFKDVIAQILSAEGALAPVPGFPAYAVSGTAQRGCLVATVWSGAPSVCLATIGIATNKQYGALLWTELHRWGEIPVVTDPDRCPPTPWVAVALDRGILQHLDAAYWLGDFERCLGWAWIEYGNPT